MGELHARERALKARLRAGLDAVAGITVHSPADPEGAGIVTFTSDALPPGRATLEAAMRRAGVHGHTRPASVHPAIDRYCAALKRCGWKGVGCS